MVGAVVALFWIFFFLFPPLPPCLESWPRFLPFLSPGLCEFLFAPLHGIFFCTVHLWVWISGTQPKGGTIPAEVAGLGSCKGSLVRVWFPFLKPHVLFFFIQGPQGLHSLRSHWTTHSIVPLTVLNPSGQLERHRPLCEYKPSIHFVQKFRLKHASQFSILHCVHLFISRFRIPKYPTGQAARQMPIWRMSFRSSKMKSRGRHFRHPLYSEQCSQPLEHDGGTSVLILLCLLPLETLRLSPWPKELRNTTVSTTSPKCIVPAAQSRWVPPAGRQITAKGTPFTPWQVDCRCCCLSRLQPLSTLSAGGPRHCEKSGHV